MLQRLMNAQGLNQKQLRPSLPAHDVDCIWLMTDSAFTHDHTVPHQCRKETSTVHTRACEEMPISD